MPACIAIGQGREQQRAGMRAHMHPVRHQRDGAEQQAADDLGEHHGPAEPDHRPGLALALFMTFAKEDMAVAVRNRV